MFLSVVSFILLSGVSHSSETLAPEPQSLGFSSSVRSVCKPIPSTLSLCHGIGYRQMRIPNLLGHDTLKEAQQQSAAWLPLISKLCHRDTKKFLCSLPCRSLCEAVRDGCVPVMSAFGFPWPEMFNCSRFPRGTGLCIAATVEHSKTPSVNTCKINLCSTKPTKEQISVEIDGCFTMCLKSHQLKFTPLFATAFKMRLGSVSTVGGDRQLVPMARSRILRWAGGDSAEMNTNRGLQEDQMDKRPGKEEGKQEGRLVLTRLVRWSRGDKELKKFIRALIKQPCKVL
uniref:FZ domain-containing protein n=1 Tax=Labrus bergylta TaxID=56723 RepID=A0A3Q3GVM9_9LABR